MSLIIVTRVGTWLWSKVSKMRIIRFKSTIPCSMGIQLSTSEMEVLRKLQRNLAGSSDYARVTCILMLGMGNSPSFVASCLGIDVSTVYRYRSAYCMAGPMNF